MVTETVESVCVECDEQGEQDEPITGDILSELVDTSSEVREEVRCGFSPDFQTLGDRCDFQEELVMDAEHGGGDIEDAEVYDHEVEPSSNSL